MGNLLSPNTKLMVDSLAKIEGIDISLMNQIEKAFADNNLKLLEQLFDKIMSDNNIGVENKLKIKELVKVHLNDVLSNNVLHFFSGDSLTSLLAMGAMFLVILAMIFREGVPLTIILLLLLGLVCMFAGFRFITSFVENMRVVERKIDASCPTSITEVADTYNESESDFVRKLVKDAGCGLLVSKNVFKTAQTLHSLRCMNVIAEVCAETVAGVQCSLNAVGKRDSDRYGLHGTKAQAKNEMEKMENSVRKVNFQVKEHITAHCNAAFQGTKMLGDIEALTGSIQFTKQNMMFKRPTCLLTPGEVTRKANMETDIRAEMLKVGRNGKDAIRDMERRGIEEFDHQEIFDQCTVLVKVFGWTAETEDAQLAALQEAQHIRDVEDQRLCDAVSKLGHAEADLNKISNEMLLRRHTFETKMHELNAKITQQKLLLQALGQGTITMSGSPPCKDRQAVLRWNMWNEGKWSELLELGTYRSGSFSITVDSKLTRRQKEGVQNLENFIDQADKTNEQFLADMVSLEKTEASAKAALEKNKSHEQASRKDCELAKKAAEPHWAVFKARHPIEYSEIQMVYAVKDYILKVAQWMFRGDLRLTALKSMYTKLENQARDEDFFDVNISMITAETIRRLLSDPNTSTISMLACLGEGNLKRQLMPSIKQAIKGKNGRMETVNKELREFKAIEVN